MSAATTFADNDYRQHHPRFAVKNRERNVTLISPLESLAAAKGATTAQIALAWMLSKKPWIVPIPGTRKTSRVIENMGALEVDLSADEIAALEAEVAQAGVAGARYDPHMMAMLNR